MDLPTFRPEYHSSVVDEEHLVPMFEALLSSFLLRDRQIQLFVLGLVCSSSISDYKGGIPPVKDEDLYVEILVHPVLSRFPHIEMPAE